MHARQHYELMNYRRADAELNYRRFFAVNTLAGIRVELPEVFELSHAEIRRWVDRGWVDGLRIDHPDGLADPGGYLDDLAELTGHRYVLVEKIIEGDEMLPPSWDCAGTTGYEALAALDRLFVDPTGEAVLDELDTQLRGGLRVDWEAMTRASKRAVADGILRSEVLRLARLVPDVEDGDDAIAELLSSFSVYRTYLPGGSEYLVEAVELAEREPAGDRRPDPRDRCPAGRCRRRIHREIPADLGHGDGQGGGGLRFLPVDQAHFAHRGGGRAGAVLAAATGPS